MRRLGSSPQAELVQFEADGFLATNVKDAIIEAKQGGTGVLYSVEVLHSGKMEADSFWVQKVSASGRVKSYSLPYVLKISGGGAVQSQSKLTLMNNTACTVEAL